LSSEFLLTILSSAILCILFYLAADFIYDVHYKLKKGGSPFTKIVTADVKNIDDKETWIKRYRAKLLLIMAVILAIPLYRLIVG